MARVNLKFIPVSVRQYLSQYIHSGKRWEIGALFIGAAITRLVNLGSPHAIVFDEVYFSKDFPTAYFSHAYYFDLHPPLGKLLLAGWMWLLHIDPASTLNATPPSLRWFVALFGVAVVMLTYGVLFRLTKSRLAAGLGGLIVLLNGTLIVQSRFVLMDSILLAFGLGAVYAALRWSEHRQLKWLIATGLLAGASASIKWTGLTPLVLALLICLAVMVRHQIPKLKTAGSILTIVALATVIYLSSFWIHFQLLNRSGDGDAFMTTAFQATLIGNTNYKSSAHMSFIKKTVQLNQEMYRANKTLTATHPYSSKWYKWPIETRPVYLWQGAVQKDGSQGNIYAVSNPLTWWLSSLSVVVAVIVQIVPALRRRFQRQLLVLGFLTIGYFINWLPFAKIGRVMFLYHYLNALLFATMLMVVLLVGWLPANRKSWQRLHYIVVGSLVTITVLGFAYIAPLNYGWRLSPQQLRDHMILHTWR